MNKFAKPQTLDFAVTLENATKLVDPSIDRKCEGASNGYTLIYSIKGCTKPRYDPL